MSPTLIKKQNTILKALVPRTIHWLLTLLLLFLVTHYLPTLLYTVPHPISSTLHILCSSPACPETQENNSCFVWVTHFFMQIKSRGIAVILTPSDLTTLVAKIAISQVKVNQRSPKQFSLPSHYTCDNISKKSQIVRCKYSWSSHTAFPQIHNKGQ